MSEASCMYTFPYDLVVRHTLVGLSRKVVRIFIMRKNILSPEYYYMSLVVRKPAFCICENKDADQLRGDREADQRLCFRYTDSTIPLLPSSEISSL